jgi:hypothetical protein
LGTKKLIEVPEIPHPKDVQRLFSQSCKPKPIIKQKGQQLTPPDQHPDLSRIQMIKISQDNKPTKAKHNPVDDLSNDVKKIIRPR